MPNERVQKKRTPAKRWRPLVERLEQRLPLAVTPIHIGAGEHFVDHHQVAGDTDDASQSSSLTESLQQLASAVAKDQLKLAELPPAPAHSRIIQDEFGQLALDDFIPVPQDQDPAPAAAPTLQGAPIPIASLPALHSLNGAAAAIYLDFDGHTEATWGTYSNVVVPVFDTDSDLTTFSDSEQAVITEVWERVAEDFAPFDIDVTTEDPGDFSNGVAVRISIGGDGDWVGETLGGVAYLSSFTNAIPNTAYVFPENLADSAKNIAEAASHETGHTFGLEHQSEYSGATLVEEYNAGNPVWAPIMGIGYYSTQTLWHNGATPTASTALQDDLAILSGVTNGFGYRADDIGDTFAAATALPSGSLSQTGIIGLSTDSDVYSFTMSATDTVVINAAGASSGTNLDIVLDLYSNSEVLIVSDAPTGTLTASINQSLSPGDYYLVVRGGGDYAEVGEYTLTGTIPSEGPPVLATIGDQTMVHNVASIDLSLSATDPDGDTITYTAVDVAVDATAALAVQLRQTHSLVAASNEALNLRGVNEKYMRGANDAWFYILPNGELYQWAGTIASSTLVGTLDSTYYADLSLLLTAEASPYGAFSGTLSISGTTLTIDPDAGFTGVFGVTVTASDGTLTDTETFGVTVTNEAPVLAAIADQTMVHTTDTLDVTLAGADADGDTITYTVTTAAVDLYAGP